MLNHSARVTESPVFASVKRINRLEIVRLLYRISRKWNGFFRLLHHLVFFFFIFWHKQKPEHGVLVLNGLKDDEMA